MRLDLLHAGGIKVILGPRQAKKILVKRRANKVSFVDGPHTPFVTSVI